MWQEILIIIVGLVAFGYAGWSVIRLFTKKESASCAGCSAECVLKETKGVLTDSCEKRERK